MKPVALAWVVLTVLSPFLLAQEIPLELANDYRRVFRALDIAARLDIVERALARGDSAGAALLVEILRRDDAREERELYRRRASICREIDDIFGRAIDQKRVLTAQEDSGLQEVKARLADVDRDIGAVVEVRWRAAEALRKFEDAGARTYLGEVAGLDRDWFVRYAAVAAIAKKGDPDPTAILAERAAKDESPQVVTAALDGLAALGAAAGFDPAIQALESEDWPVRAAAIRCAGSLGDLRAVRPLLDRLAKEKGRLKGDIDRELLLLTGFSAGGDSARWEGWWKVHGPAIEGGSFVRKSSDGPGAVVTGITFYGIRTLSTRILFVLDTSRSMADPTKSKIPVTGGPDGAVEPEGNRKIDVARAQLKNAILALGDGAEFDIVFYRQGVELLSPKMVKKTPKTMAKAFEWIDEKRPAGGTNIFDSLHRALNLDDAVDSGARITDANYGSLVDTVFLLSDGEPNYGRLQSAEKMVLEIERLDAYRKVVFHAIGVGEHDKAFMQRLAEVTGGQYAGFE